MHAYAESNLQELKYNSAAYRHTHTEHMQYISIKIGNGDRPRQTAYEIKLTLSRVS